MGDVVRVRVYVCVELRDAFTNRIIGASGTQVRLNNRAAGEVKDNRFFVFQRAEGEEFFVSVRAAGYDLREGIVSHSERQPGDFFYTESGVDVFSLCLYPGRDYILPPGYGRVSVSGTPGEEVRSVIDPGAPVFLTEDYGGGLSVPVKARGDMAGKMCRIEGGNGEWEDFFVTGWEEGGPVFTDAGLRGKYPKGSRVYGLYCAVADEEGRAVVIRKEGAV